MNTHTIDYLDGRFKVAGWPAVAVYVSGYVQMWAPDISVIEDDDGMEIEVEFPGEGEWIDDVEGGMVRVVMVGDDHEHVVDIGDLTKIDDLDYCAECGQIGCCHDGRERES